MTTSTTGHTFAGSNARKGLRLLKHVGYREAIESLSGLRIESCSARLHTSLVPCR